MSDRLKILHVAATYLPARRYGGPIVAVHGLCKALAARGHAVDVFTTNVDGSATLDVPTAERVALDGVGVHYFPVSFRRLYWSPEMAHALRESVRLYDVVHTHGVYLWPGVTAAREARAAAIPYVISPRGMLVPELIAKKQRVVKSLWLRAVERRALAGATAIHFTSQLEWSEARRVGVPLSSPFVVPNGIDVEPLPNVTRNDHTILFLGRINWKKNLGDVIAQLPKLDRVRLIIAGNDEEGLAASLAETAERLGVRDRVFFSGPVYGNAKNRLLAEAALLVLVSTSENFGNVVLEALAMKTPVILSPGVGLAEEVVAAKAGAIGLDSIPALLADPRSRAEMGRQGRALVEQRFTWDRVAEEMEREYLAIT